MTKLAAAVATVVALWATIAVLSLVPPSAPEPAPTREALSCVFDPAAIVAICDGRPRLNLDRLRAVIQEPRLHLLAD